MVRGSMKGYVVVDNRGRVQGGTLDVSAAGAKDRLTSLHDVAEPAGSWTYWHNHGYAAVRCEVFAAANHKRRAAPRS